MRPREDHVQRFIWLAAAIRAEVTLLQRVTDEAHLALQDFPEAVPPPRELRGIANIVHDFYTGSEHVFEKISAALDGGVPNGPARHRELLEGMALDLPSLRPPVLTRSTVRLLEEFLRFRHLFRNVYGFELEWERLKPLLSRMPTSWAALCTDLAVFLAFLDAGGAKA
ncbi:MAG: hypothetical protein ABI895_09590 [Deltaproteobacteria bacterium]